MRIYNVIMSSLFTGIIVHELTHALFYQQIHYIGFVFNGEAFAQTVGYGLTPHPEALAYAVQVIVMFSVFYFTRREDGRSTDYSRTNNH